MALSAKALGSGLGDALEPGGSESVGWITSAQTGNESATQSNTALAAYNANSRP
jgi:hypothetical protein